MQSIYTEQSYEKAVIELFQNMGYTHVYGPSVENRDFQSPFYDDILVDSINKINPKAPQEAIQDALFKLKNIEHGDIVQQNMVFMYYLQSGIEARYTQNGEQRTTLISLEFFNEPKNIYFIVEINCTFI